jgi:hypothetical protein
VEPDAAGRCVSGRVGICRAANLFFDVSAGTMGHLVFVSMRMIVRVSMLMVMSMIVGLERSKGDARLSRAACFASFVGGDALRHLEPVAEHELLVGEDVSDRSVGEESAFIEQESAMAGIEDEIEAVTGDDAGDGEGIEDVAQFASASWIKIAGGFVHQDDVGMHGDDTCDGDATSFAGGEMEGDAFVAVRRETDLGKGTINAAPDFVRGQAEIEGPESDVIGDRGVNDLVVGVLEDDPEFLVDLAASSGGGEIATGDGDGALEVLDETGQDEEQRGFAGAVGADQADTFAMAQVECDIAKRLAAFRIAVREVIGFNEAAHGSPDRSRIHRPVANPRQTTDFIQSAGLDLNSCRVRSRP